MIRAVLIAIVVAVSFAFASPTQKPACMAVNPAQMAYVVHVPEFPNFMGLRFEVKAKYGHRTHIDKVVAQVPVEQPKVVPKPKAKPALKNVQIAKKRNSASSVRKNSPDICKAPRHAVWRTLKNGYRKYRCK